MQLRPFTETEMVFLDPVAHGALKAVARAEQSADRSGIREFARLGSVGEAALGVLITQNTDRARVCGGAAQDQIKRVSRDIAAGGSLDGLLRSTAFARRFFTGSPASFPPPAAALARPARRIIGLGKGLKRQRQQQAEQQATGRGQFCFAANFHCVGLPPFPPPPRLPPPLGFSLGNASAAFVAAVFRVHEPVVIAHFELAGRDEREARPFLLGQRSGDAKRYGGGHRTHRFPETRSCHHSKSINGIPRLLSTGMAKEIG